MTTDNLARIAPATAHQFSWAASRRRGGPDRLIVSWLATQLASYLQVDAAAINPMAPLAEMRVDSVHGISLVSDIEAHFDIDVDPTLIFDYPTLSHIAEYISTAATEQQEVVA
jgi:acyl carrier protein